MCVRVPLQQRSGNNDNCPLYSSDGNLHLLCECTADDDWSDCSTSDSISDGQEWADDGDDSGEEEDSEEEEEKKEEEEEESDDSEEEEEESKEEDEDLEYNIEDVASNTGTNI